ncbi:NAD-dependent succinate-semialdehyde dehydrogenase [Limnobacter humi]|uniref:NAD-dependent succinate-semialdehyde dehydrogenase n=1 Tax=Limnobacter humi TaxID=1778671 RepID=A0ABT1WHD0_9BURK|nr:NAD-dependent succinate-semialdehyde dehydrogenase [Limnobacter humi]MCQ8896819.1 NAD-dependent succinate-semialdehyde dehydrogenase [Limnobacter humi]
MPSPITLSNPALLQTQPFINGAFVPCNQTFPVDNPATGATIAEVGNASVEQTSQAIEHADQAFQSWKNTTAKSRAQLLRKWFDLIVANTTDLATLMTLEQGKPLAEAKGEVTYGASFVEWFAEQAKRIEGSVLESPQAGRELLVLKQGIGVCAAITPWNFPIAMITRKVAPALAAGCTVVIKPAEQTPLSALALAELARQAGIPPGVLNVITADSDRSIEVGKVLCESDAVRKLTFTGSTEVGRILMKQCAPTIKKLSLELGGHAPFIVFEDADLDKAVDGLMASKFRNAGQTCVCTNRIYVHRSIQAAFAGKLQAKVAALEVGDGLATSASVGPMIDEQAVAKVKRHVDDAVAKGATVLAGGQSHALGGRFFQPTLINNANHDMLVAQEETFGPLAAVFPFDTEAEAIFNANNTPYGLAAYFYTENTARTFRVARALDYGMVGINVGVFSNEVGPFGGVKQSGLGREGSVWGIEEFLEIKYLCIGVQ